MNGGSEPTPVRLMFLFPVATHTHTWFLPVAQAKRDRVGPLPRLVNADQARAVAQWDLETAKSTSQQEANPARVAATLAATEAKKLEAAAFDPRRLASGVESKKLAGAIEADANDKNKELHKLLLAVMATASTSDLKVACAHCVDYVAGKHKKTQLDKMCTQSGTKEQVGLRLIYRGRIVTEAAFRALYQAVRPQTGPLALTAAGIDTEPPVTGPDPTDLPMPVAADSAVTAPAKTRKRSAGTSAPSL